MPEISSLNARQILDSRGNPTIEVDATLSDGSCGRAAVPSGSSTGSHESLELRDKEKSNYAGKGVEQAIKNVEQKIFKYVKDQDPLQQLNLDNEMVLRDGSDNLRNLGANAVLAVSLAISKAAAESEHVPYYLYIQNLYQQILKKINLAEQAPHHKLKIPTPMFNVLNGGTHTNWQSTDVQEFMLVPLKKDTFAEHLRWCSEIYHTLSTVLENNCFDTTVGDEGGFAPKVTSDTQAIEMILEAIEKSGYKAGEDIGIGIDVAASQFWNKGKYELKIQKKTLTSVEMVEMWESWAKNYPIVSIEDGLSEDDWEGWQLLNQKLGKKMPIVGDDLLVTNLERIEMAIEKDACNSLLMKVNQIGTLSESLLAAALSKSQNWEIIVSHRSGETEDTSIADISVGMGADKIKAGAPAHSERTAKYNQLLRIEEELGT
jgi:enolase